MASARFRFHAELNDFLPTEQAHHSINYVFTRRPAIKDAIEAIGVPHTDVAAILVNNVAVDFGHGLNDADDVAVYPHSKYPVVDKRFLQPFLPAGRPAFVLDVHLGKLARYLRSAGFDTLYNKVDIGDAMIAEIADTQTRIVVSRDTGLLKRSRIRYGYWLRNTQSRAQFRELVTHYQLQPWFKLFSRCPHCNAVVGTVDKKDINDRLPAGVASDPNLTEFVQCTDCAQVYWQGSHYAHMQHFFDSVS